MFEIKPIIFIHLPKTAGTSLRDILSTQIKNKHKPDNIVIPENKIKPYEAYVKKWWDTIGWFSLYGFINWNKQYTYYIDENTFDWSFLHIPSISLWEYWLNNVKNKSNNEIIEIHLNRTPSHDYPKSYDYMQSIPADLDVNKLYKNFNWITIFRHPVGRITSEYYYITKLADWEKELLWSHINKKSTFMEYINMKETFNTQVKHLMGKGYLSNYEVTESECNKLIDTIEKLNFKVGIFEKLEESIKYWNKSFNFNMKYEDMPHKRKSLKPELSEEIKELIKINNKWDIKLYEYFLEKLNNV